MASQPTVRSKSLVNPLLGYAQGTSATTIPCSGHWIRCVSQDTQQEYLPNPRLSRYAVVDFSCHSGDNVCGRKGSHLYANGWDGHESEYGSLRPNPYKKSAPSTTAFLTLSNFLHNVLAETICGYSFSSLVWSLIL